MRTATISRKTSETSIDVTVNLDGTGAYEVSTGIGLTGIASIIFSRSTLT